MAAFCVVVLRSSRSPHRSILLTAVDALAGAWLRPLAPDPQPLSVAPRISTAK
jgi:hypothetical protein